MGKSKKEQKAITLIALVVTIVVLLILAGISIATLTGENGIINKAQEAKKKTEQAQKEEEEKLADIEDILGTDTSGFNEEKGVNSPRIGDTENKTGLIPIKYIGSGKWEVCAETDPEWYNYKEDEMNWANAMLSDGTYKKGEVEVGQEIEEKDLGSMFVWIPRYAYSITEYKTEKDLTEGTKQKITNVEFLKGRTNTGTSGETYGTNYNAESVAVGSATPKIVHPAFTFGGENLRGIWVAKFEASMAETNNNTTTNNNVLDKTIKIVPNAESWRYINIGNAFKTCLNMKNNTIYQLANTTNTHQMKNNEWGAVTYLAASQYGVVPAKNASGSSYTEDSTTKYHSYSANGDYVTNVNQSTTGNETGIYDMNGGAREYVAAYWDNGNSNLSGNGSNEIFPSNKLNAEYVAYFDKYEVSKNEIENGITAWNTKSTEGNKMLAKMAYERVQLMKNVKGDAIAEVLNTFSYYGRYSKEYTEGSTTYSPYNYTSWFKATYDADGNVTATGEDTLWSYGRSYYNNDFILVGEVYRPFLLRGGHWSNDAYTGVFTSSGYAGGAYNITRFSSSGGVLDVDV